jgi:hypothetical protein
MAAPFQSNAPPDSRLPLSKGLSLPPERPLTKNQRHATSDL